MYHAREVKSNGFVPIFLKLLLKDTFYFATYRRSSRWKGSEEGDRWLSI